MIPRPRPPSPTWRTPSGPKRSSHAGNTHQYRTADLIDALTADRRARLAAASRQLPDLYVITLLVSGGALIANAGVLTMHVRFRGLLIIGGLTAVVGLSIALIFALATPWRGPIVVSGHPLDAVMQDLTSGYFHS